MEEYPLDVDSTANIVAFFDRNDRLSARLVNSEWRAAVDGLNVLAREKLLKELGQLEFYSPEGKAYKITSAEIFTLYPAIRSVEGDWSAVLERFTDVKALYQDEEAVVILTDFKHALAEVDMLSLFAYFIHKQQNPNSDHILEYGLDFDMVYRRIDHPKSKIPKLMEFLIKITSSPEIRKKNYSLICNLSSNLLHDAAIHGYVDIINLCLAYYPDSLNRKTKKSITSISGEVIEMCETPLVLAVMTLQLGACKILLSHGADPLLGIRSSVSAFNRAIQNNFTPMLEALVDSLLKTSKPLDMQDIIFAVLQHRISLGMIKQILRLPLTIEHIFRLYSGEYDAEMHMGRHQVTTRVICTLAEAYKDRTDRYPETYLKFQEKAKTRLRDRLIKQEDFNDWHEDALALGLDPGQFLMETHRYIEGKQGPELEYLMQHNYCLDLYAEKSGGFKQLLQSGRAITPSPQRLLCYGITLNQDERRQFINSTPPLRTYALLLNAYESFIVNDLPACNAALQQAHETSPSVFKVYQNAIVKKFPIINVFKATAFRKLLKEFQPAMACVIDMPSAAPCLKN